MKIEELKHECEEWMKYPLKPSDPIGRYVPIVYAAISDYEDAEKVDENGLKGCPFCGGKPAYDLDDDGWVAVTCTECYVVTQHHPHESPCEGSAEFDWNTRPQAKASAAIARIVGE